jgi:DNA-binding XRE family transcriptional regulator
MANELRNRNNVQRLREEQLMSKAELARRAGVSVLTIDRVERGASCRVDTKRKIILALGMKVTDRTKVFSDSLESGLAVKQE